MKRVILFLNACLLCGHVIAGNDVKLASTGDVQSVKTYKVGDYYNENGKEGVVFEVDATGCHGKIISMKCASKSMPWIAKVSNDEVFTDTIDKTDGMKNMQKIMNVEGWRKKYPAFAWCAELGDGWYLPAIKELEKFTLDDSIYDAVNSSLLRYGGDALTNQDNYWSSSEKNEWCAWAECIGNGDTYNYKFILNLVRAVSVF